MKRLALIAPLALAACQPAKPVLILPPAELATCAAEPVAPAIPGQDQQAERDRLVFEYLLALRAAGGDCRAKVNGLATWRREASQ